MTVVVRAAAFAGAPTAQSGQRLRDGLGRVDLVVAHASILHAT
jgi:hypothetical protein